MMTVFLRTFSVAVALTLVQPASANEQNGSTNFQPRPYEFRNSCAHCHGVDGKGAGFLIRLFKGVDPGDLTQLTKNNEGEFPLDRIFQTIDGRDEVAAHGEREMPVWGDRYMEQYMYEYEPAQSNELRVRSQVLELMYYIQSIQEK